MDFCPISLVGDFYKLLAKVLANKLKRVVGKVISNTQHAFLKGANEAIKAKRLKKWGNMQDGY